VSNRTENQRVGLLCPMPMIVRVPGVTGNPAPLGHSLARPHHGVGLCVHASLQSFERHTLVGWCACNIPAEIRHRLGLKFFAFTHSRAAECLLQFPTLVIPIFPLLHLCSRWLHSNVLNQWCLPFLVMRSLTCNHNKVWQPPQDLRARLARGVLPGSKKTSRG
jgi:hypothetical protein